MFSFLVDLHCPVGVAVADGGTATMLLLALTTGLVAVFNSNEVFRPSLEKIYNRAEFF